MGTAADRLARLAWGVLVYNLAVILWGAYVRASGSGAGCGSHWPLCNGEIVPRSAQAATWIEFSHRVTSGLALLGVVALVIAAWRWSERGERVRSAAAASGVFMLSEAAVGAGLVLFQLVADNASLARALFMAVHLVNTFFLLGALALTAHFAGPSGRRALAVPDGGRGLGRTAVALALFGLLLVGVSGALAALGDTLQASLPESLTRDTSSTAYGLIRLRVLHPFIALAVGLGVMLLSLRVLSLRDHPARRPAQAVLALTLLQLAAGALDVLLRAPIWLQLVHLLLADLLWIAFLLMAAVTLGLRSRDALPPAAWVAAARGPQTPH
jgi:heme A synthase